MKTKKSLAGAYTILFLILCAILLSYFYGDHRSLVWCAGAQDGPAQHLNAAAYWGQYIREFFSNLIQGHPKFPMWSMSISYGSDILETLNYYAIGDPLNLIYAFSDRSNVEYFYAFALILRMYLAGLSFAMYGSYMKKDHRGVLLASLIYVFSGILFKGGLRHPFFMNPMIYFPLLCIGVEKIFRKERPHLFVIMTAVSAVSNFYFFYMLTALTVVYALIRFPSYKKEKGAKFFRSLVRFAGWYLLGVGISAVILIPVIIGFLGNGRNGSDVNYFTYFFYPLNYYKQGVLQFIGFGRTGRGLNMNFAAVALTAAAALFFQKKKGRAGYKTAFLLMVLFAVSPICGYILHGFSYPANRWAFGITFTIAAIVMEMYPDLLRLSRIQAAGILLTSAAYIAVFYILSDGGQAFGSKAIICLLLGWIAVIFAVNYIRILSSGAVPHLLMLSAACVSIWAMAEYNFSPKKTTVLSEYLPAGEAVSYLEGDGAGLLKTVKETDGSLYRSEAGSSNRQNWGLLDDVPNTSNYFSITDGNVSETLREFELQGYQYAFKFRNLNQRIGLMSLYSVKYASYKLASDGSARVPEGFRMIGQKDGYGLYENTLALPFGYTYDAAISRSEYEKMNPLEKEQALLQYAVLEDGDDADLKKTKPETDVRETTAAEDQYLKKEGRTADTLKIRVPVTTASGETYIRLQGINCETNDSGTRSHMMVFGENSNPLAVKINGKQYQLTAQQNGAVYYIGARSYMIPVDVKSGQKEITLEISLKEEGQCRIDRISLVTMDSQDLYDAINERRQSECLENIRYDRGNHFSGEISLKNRKMLCISIPYSSGWKAWDNGKEAEIHKINGMSMGIMLDEGSHEIRLSYTTPGLLIGAAVTAAGCVLFVALTIRMRKREN